MSQGFETKSADGLQNAREERKSKEIADIGSIQQSKRGAFWGYQRPDSRANQKNINSKTS